MPFFIPAPAVIQPRNVHEIVFFSGGIVLFLARGSVMLCVASTLQSGREVAMQYPDGWWAQREQIVRQVRGTGGRQLIIVGYSPGIATSRGYREWVRNLADLDGAEVLWARGMGAERDRELLDYYHDRHTWLLDVTSNGINLTPYPQ